MIIEGVRRRAPPLLSLELLAGLRAQGARIHENPIAPGEVNHAHVGFDVDVFVHVLQGLDLSTADRVSFELRVEETGQLMIAIDNAPFDRAGGRVLLACSIHYRGLPPNLVAEVRAIDEGGTESRAQYTIHHTFDSGDPGPV